MADEDHKRSSSSDSESSSSSSGTNSEIKSVKSSKPDKKEEHKASRGGNLAEEGDVELLPRNDRQSR